MIVSQPPPDRKTLESIFGLELSDAEISVLALQIKRIATLNAASIVPSGALFDVVPAHYAWTPAPDALAPGEPTLGKKSK